MTQNDASTDEMERDIRDIIDRMKSGHEIKHPDAYRCQEIWAEELEEALNQYAEGDTGHEYKS